MITYTSPSIPNKNIKKLINMIDSEFDYEIVPIIPETFAKNGHCYYNVIEKIKLDGGSMQLGWSIYQSEYMCEAEKHAVWCNEEGDLIDITPNGVSGLSQIMFIPDDRPQGLDVDSKRINLTDSKAIDTLIQLFTINNELFDRYGKRINQTHIELPKAAKDLYEKIKEYITHYQIFTNQKINKLTKCYCNSGKSYNNCHAKITIDSINQEIKKLEKLIK